MTCIDGPGNVPGGTNCGSNLVCDGFGFCGMCTQGQSCSGNPGICYDGTASCSTGMSMCVNGAPKMAGTGCGTNMVCNGGGGCVACTAGISCTGNPNPCKSGTTTCSTGSQTCIDGGNKMGGVNCGTNMVCNGMGACIGCTAGQTCMGNPNPCKNGTSSCMTGALTCVDGGNKSAGTICGTNLVCDGAGGCVPCTAGTACTTNPSICKNGMTSCMTGMQTCVDGANKSPGTNCGTNLVCDPTGTCISCTAGGACTGNPNVCKNGVNSCSTGALTCADGSNKMGGTNCGPNMVCDGNGTCGNCTANQTCTTNPNNCYTGITSCMTGTMMCNNNTAAPKAAGTNCGTNMVCNGSGTCVPCTAGLACTTNPGQCFNGVTSCSTGVQTCVNGTPKTNGTGCNDGDACTYGEYCSAGICTGGNAYYCPLGACITDSRCDGSGGCINTIVPNNTFCGYPEDCTCCQCSPNGKCQNGVCHFTSCCSTAICCGA
jgi:hypothetical protein